MTKFASDFYKVVKLNTMKKKKGHIILWIMIIIGLAVVTGAGAGYYILFAPNFETTEEERYIYIHDNCSFDELTDQLHEKGMKNIKTFRLTARVLKYDTQIKTGRYKINKGMSNARLIRKLRNGNQDPVRLTFNNIRTKEQLAGRISRQLMADSLSILTLLNDTEFLSSHGLNKETAVSYFIPNTYEFFWDTDASELFLRMKREYEIFWNEDRKAKAAAIPLSQIEVLTLASIIEEESNKSFEHPIIAGLYINRLKRGMPLQACPTVKFALNDFTIQRILYKHLETQSPYNTYIYQGLPPGPIRMASIRCIDAVLNYEKHNYIFMTAKEDFSGEHNFAATGDEHARNARRYQQALNKRGIR